MRARLLLFGACAAALVGCTVIQPIVPNNSPSYDGKIRNSGVIGVLRDNQILVTGYAKTTYESLVKIYGMDFATPLTSDDSAVFDPIPGKYYHIKDKDHRGYFILYTADPSKAYYEIDAQYMVKYLDMCDWYNSGIDANANDPHVSPSTNTKKLSRPIPGLYGPVPSAALHPRLRS